MGVIIFNGASSLDYGIQVELIPDYEFPDREYEIVRVPGRNGNVVIDKHSFANVMRQYYVAITAPGKPFVTMANTLATWLNSDVGYLRLEDSYEPEYFRHALYQASDTITNIWDQAGRTTLKFDCKPQRFLKSGEEIINNILPTNQIFNPTMFKAKPIIRVYGTGSGTISFTNGRHVEVENMYGVYPIEIDCELENAKRENENYNGNIKVNSKFPEIIPGYSTITLAGNISKLEIIPRWWTI